MAVNLESPLIGFMVDYTEARERRCFEKWQEKLEARNVNGKPGKVGSGEFYIIFDMQYERGSTLWQYIVDVSPVQKV